MAESESRPTTSAGKILLIDDDDALAEAVSDVLRSRGYEVMHRDDGNSGLELAMEEDFDAVLTDLRMPGTGGMAVLDKMLVDRPQVPVILMTAYSSTSRAIEATKHGAYDYLAKPFEMPELLEVLGKAVETRRLAAKRVALGVYEADSDVIVGSSRIMREVFKSIGRVAAKPVAVLIRGETGTGKELVARAIRQHSMRADKPYVTVNCAAIPDNLIESELFGHERGAFTGAASRRIGRFEQAHGGTLFLDEIGDLPARTQVKLLRVLQEGKISRVGSNDEIEIDVRIISATHRDLEEMLNEGGFREDLLYRLNTVVIMLPPLRERREDIKDLVRFILAKHAGSFGGAQPVLEESALKLLENQPWPGNVRQLENVVKRAMIASGGSAVTRAGMEESLRFASAPARPLAADAVESMASLVANRLRDAADGIHPDGGWAVLMADLEEETYRQAVRMCHGNQSRIAKLLGVSRITVRDKLDRYDLYPRR